MPPPIPRADPVAEKLWRPALVEPPEPTHRWAYHGAEMSGGPCARWRWEPVQPVSPIVVSGDATSRKGRMPEGEFWPGAAWSAMISEGRKAASRKRPIVPASGRLRRFVEVAPPLALKQQVASRTDDHFGHRAERQYLVGATKGGSSPRSLVPAMRKWAKRTGAASWAVNAPERVQAAANRLRFAATHAEARSTAR